MSKHPIKLEYIWLDGHQPEPQLRSKTKIDHVEDPTQTPAIEDLSGWSFDGSSTEQAEGGDSDCALKPVFICPDPDRINGYLVLCEVLTKDNEIHPSNHRGTFADDSDLWMAFEQEYVIIDPETDLPLGFPKGGFAGPQGPYYCGAGTNRVVGRDFVEEHLDLCLEAGLGITGINAEVMVGQWEFQCFAKGAKRACDELWVARYLLERTAEKYGYIISIQPKPVKGDWNGSGMHVNFSNTAIREQGGKELIETICEKFRATHEEHIAVYGSENDQRLTGLHETSSMDQFSYGVSDRGCSIRIPLATAANDWKGYLEDRRPASSANPYLIASRLIATLNS